MVRTLRVGAVLGLLLLLPGSPAPLAASEPPPFLGAAAAGAPIEWTTIEEGVQVLRLWDHVVPVSETQIALLRLRDDKFRQYRGDEQKFINDRHIFPVEVNELLAPCAVQVREGAPEDKTGLYWLIMMPHWPDSYRFCLCSLDWRPPNPVTRPGP